MNRKRYVIVLLSALAFMPGWTRLTAEPVIFFFSGQITERRATNSVFTEPNTDQFYGYFSYDTAATSTGPGVYPLLSFSVDGNSLIFTNSMLVLAIGTPSIWVNNNPFYGGGDSIQIRGIYPPAASNPGDYGTTRIRLTDSSGLVFTNNSLPTTLSLSSFDIARLEQSIGPSFPWPKTTYDRGTITQLTQVPEPAAWGLLGLGLLAASCRKRRARSRAPRAEP